MNSNTRAYVNAGALVVVMVFNYLSNALPFNQLTQQNLSELFPVLFTPASYVFSIWGLIYLLLIGFVVYQIIPAYRDHPLVAAVGPWFAVSCFFNILWLFAWHYLQIGLSLVIMLLLLGSLAIIYRNVNVPTPGTDLYSRILVRLPFSIYLGWISVATIANFNIFLYDVGWLGTEWGAVLFTMLMVVAGTLVALFWFQRQRDYAPVLVFVWAFIGIGVRHGSDVVLLTLTAWAAAIVLVFFMGWLTARRPPVAT